MSEGLREKREASWLRVEQAKVSINAGVYEGDKALDILAEAILKDLSK